MTHDGEDGLDRVSRAQMLPVLGRQVVEGQQGIAVGNEFFGRRGVFRLWVCTN